MAREISRDAKPTRRDLRAKLLRTKAAVHAALAARFGEAKWVAAEVLDGKILWLNLCDRHVSMGALSGMWEETETQFLRRMLRLGHVFVDVGANIGWFSLVAAECVGRQGRVHAFEPQQRISAYLARTVAANDLNDIITTYDCALSDRAGTQRIVWDRHGANMGRAWLASAGDEARTTLNEVTLATLDALLPDAHVDVMKIDTEGAELLVLRGAATTIARCRPLIMLEIVAPLLQKVSNATPDALHSFFSKQNYRAFVFDDAGTLVPLQDSAVPTRSDANAVFVPAERADLLQT
ncbi:FkbM family methyltransferase [Methylovirgula sp. 4M-Z18]|uniref:FkbM family methyltransferase n=1 Tax=Methylovirgula sp. 4M-Z18 TaxID=2293567 RepID=UPI0011C081F6|nr:FkbM family methyltransferase [Methylovirgula sp. 4M-Z18]